MGLFRKKRGSEIDDGQRGRHPRYQQPQPPGPTRNNPVFSYYKAQNRPATEVESKPTRQFRMRPDETYQNTKAREQKFRSSHIPTYVALAVILLCIGYSLSLSSNPKVIIINDKSRAIQPLLRDSETYRKAIEERLRRSPLSYTKATLDTNKLAEQTRQDFPELANASVTVPIAARRPVVYLTIAQPAFMVNGANTSFVLDNQGRALLKASEVPNIDALHLTTINDQTSTQFHMGQRVLPTSQVAFMQAMTKQMKAKGVQVEAFTLPPKANELNMQVAGQKYYVKFNFLGDARLQAGAYLATKQKLEADKINPTEYVDVRVPERAYYK